MKSGVQQFLMIDGVKHPVSGVSYNDEGKIISLQVIKDFTVQGYVDIDSTLEGYEKIDFASCYIEEYPILVELLKEHMERVKRDIDDLAHAAIPDLDEEIDIETIMEVWMQYHMLRRYFDGLYDALQIIKQ